MNYTQLSNDYKYDTIAQNIYGREIEYFHYDFDKTNFEYLIANTPDGSYKDNVKERLASTLEQMENVKAVYAALMSQVDDQEAYAAAVERTTKKRLEESQ